MATCKRYYSLDSSRCSVRFRSRSSAGCTCYSGESFSVPRRMSAGPSISGGRNTSPIRDYLLEELGSEGLLGRGQSLDGSYKIRVDHGDDAATADDAAIREGETATSDSSGRVRACSQGRTARATNPRRRGRECSNTSYQRITGSTRWETGCTTPISITRRGHSRKSTPTSSRIRCSRRTVSNPAGDPYAPGTEMTAGRPHAVR